MGTNKAELLYKNRTFLEHMLDKARALGIEKCYLSGCTAQRSDVQTVQDQLPDRGPLGGIHACMKEMDTPFCLVLPVDAPLLPRDILEEMLLFHESRRDPSSVLIWEHGNRKEPLIAIYPIAMVQAIEDLIKDRPVPVFRALDRWGYECFRLETDETLIINVNTPELYQKILENR